MTKLIAAVIIVAVLYGGWEFFLYWEKVKNDEESEKKQAAAAQWLPQQLSGMPYQLESSLETAQKHGLDGLREWLKVYGSRIDDPRKAWIELDYVELVSRQDTAEAKRIFADVKRRTPESSKV